MKLHIGNLATSVTEPELSELITPLATPSSVEIVKDPSGTSRGYAFAVFGTDDEARAVIAGLNGKNVGGQELKLGEARARKNETRPATSA